MTDLFDYIALAKNAEALIHKFGDTCTVVTNETIPAPNPIDPPQVVQNRFSTRGVFLRYRLEDIDGVNILRADQRLLLPSSVPLVQVQGLIERGQTEKWKVISVEQLRPGPTKMLWKVQVRQ